MSNKKKSKPLTQEELDFMRPDLTKAMLGLTIREKQRIIRDMVRAHYIDKRLAQLAEVK